MVAQIISRTFSLIPKSQNKRAIMNSIKRYFMKFRDLENIYIETLLYALRKGKLTIEDFSMKLDFEKVIDFFIKNTKDSFTRDYLNYLFSLCKLQDLQGEILVKRIKEIFNIYLEFFHQLEQDILD